MEGEFETPIQTNSSNSFAATTISKESSRVSEDFAIEHQSSRSASKGSDQSLEASTDQQWVHKVTQRGLDFNRRSRAAAEVASRSSDPFPWLPFTATWVRTERGPRVNLTDSRTNSVPAERIAFEWNALVEEWVRKNITQLYDMAEAMLKSVPLNNRAAVAADRVPRICHRARSLGRCRGSFFKRLYTSCGPDSNRIRSTTGKTRSEIASRFLA